MRMRNLTRRVGLALALGIVAAAARGVLAQTVSEGPIAASSDRGSAQEKVLDRVVAVVNNQVILASDLDLERRIFHLLSIGDASDYAAPKALDRLITRALIEQQILLEDPKGTEVEPKELEDQLTQLRESLPACKRRDCGSATGWASYLATLDLTPDRVKTYWANRIAILRFIEQRFRSGIRISPEEIRRYYQTDLLPRYTKQEDAPSLAKLSDRIQEILLQQQVNSLLNDWLKSLQSQGQVEVLDAALRTPLTDPESEQKVPPVSGPVVPQGSLPVTVSPSSISSPGIAGGANSEPSSIPPASAPPQGRGDVP